MRLRILNILSTHSFLVCMLFRVKVGFDRGVLPFGYYRVSTQIDLAAYKNSLGFASLELR